MKIILERPKCIGCGACVAVCEQYFELLEDGLSHVKCSIKDANENEELEISEQGCASEAVEVCPVQVIKIV